MTAKQSRKPTASQPMRIGEGHVVDLMVVPSSESGMSHYSVDTSLLPVPDRRLSCDTVSIVNAEYLVKLIFAQKEAVANGYLSALIVQMSYESISNFINTMVQVEEAFTSLAKSPHFRMGKLVDIKEKPSQTAVVTASMVLAGYSGSDACLDFYYVSPFSMHSINYGNRVSIESVVRVNIPTTLFIALYGGLKALEPSLPKLTGGPAYVDAI